MAFVWVVIAAASAPVTKVTVLDGQFRHVRTISSEGELARFNELWSRRVDVGPGVIVRHFYKLQIVRNGRSTSWFYDPDGLSQVLAVHAKTVYLLPSVADFNALLAIATR